MAAKDSNEHKYLATNHYFLVDLDNGEVTKIKTKEALEHQLNEWDSEEFDTTSHDNIVVIKGGKIVKVERGVVRVVD